MTRRWAKIENVLSSSTGVTIEERRGENGVATVIVFAHIEIMHETGVVGVMAK